MNNIYEKVLNSLCLSKLQAAELDRENGIDSFEIEVYAIVIGNVPQTSSTKVSHSTLFYKWNGIVLQTSYKKTQLIHFIIFNYSVQWFYKKN